MAKAPGVVSSAVDAPLSVMYGMPALTMVGTSVAPWPVKGSTTAATPFCTMSLAQVCPPAGVD